MAQRLKCPHCGYEPEYGVYVCQGCQAEIIYGIGTVEVFGSGCSTGIIVLIIVAFLGAVTGINGVYDISMSMGFIAFLIGCYLKYNKTKEKIRFRR